MKEYQDLIRNFDKERGWANHWNLKDLCLNLNEEIGELWSLVKWVDEEKQKIIIREHKEEVSDFVGDSLFLILKLANQTDVDASKALKKSIDDFKNRMPAKQMVKVKHANKLAGGIDNK